jgi:tetratricopeptide (TPR) repeat protein
MAIALEHPEHRVRRAEALLDRGNQLRVAGRHRKAAKVLVRAQAAAERAYGKRSLELRDFLNARGIICKYLARWTLGFTLYRRALRLAEAAGDFVMQASIEHNLAGLYHARGQYARGEPHARRAVELRKRARGTAHELAQERAALAALLEPQGKLDEAERLFGGALKVFARHRDWYELGVNESNLATLMFARGKLDEAERLYRRSLRHKRRSIGPDHPDTAITLHNLGMVVCCGKRAEARRHLAAALLIFERTLGRRHPTTRASRENLAALDHS